jgi:heterodisulfide reductase subunit A
MTAPAPQEKDTGTSAPKKEAGSTTVPRIGVFVCHCGSNIAGVVDCGRVREAAEKLPGVVVAKENKYTCSDLGQAEIIKAIKENGLDRVVVASCSPRLHEPTFRKCIQQAGLNPYLLHMVNIR